MRSVDPSPVALRSYVAVMMWGAGVASAGGHAANAVSQALVSRPQQTILGPVTFNDRGQGDLPTHAVFAWRGGKLAPAE